MKFVPETVTRMVGRQVLVAQKNAPTILFGAGVVGVVTSTVLACRSTLKLDSVLEEAEQNRSKAELVHKASIPTYTEADYHQDLRVIQVKTAAAIVKLYAPAIIVGTLSIACLAKSHNILSRRNAALSAAYAAADKAFREYRKRVVDEYGEEKDREFRYGAEEKTILEQTEKGTKKTTELRRGAKSGGSMYARFFEETNPNWHRIPEYNWTFLHGQQRWANDRLRARGYLFLNEVYESLGIEKCSYGQVVGWVYKGPEAGDGYVDFGIFDGQNFDKVFEFMIGDEGSVLLDFNVDGEVHAILDQIETR